MQCTCSREPKKAAKIIIIRETVLQSWLRDLGTFAMAAGLIGVGWALGSTAMQWFGFIATVIFLTARCSSRSRESLMTPTEASDWLWSQYQVKGGDR